MASISDVLIVGGGVMGCSIAFHLARRKAGRVVLLEKSYLAAGSSGKSGAICRQHYSNALTVSMARGAAGAAPVAAALAIAVGVLSNTVMKLGLALVLGSPRFKAIAGGALALMLVALAGAALVL